KMRVSERITQFDVEFVVIDVVQKHVHTRKVIGGVVDLLPEETFLNHMRIKMLFSLQQQGTRTTGRVIDFIDLGLLVHGYLRNQLGYMLRCKKFAAGFAGIGSII